MKDKSETPKNQAVAPKDAATALDRRRFLRGAAAAGGAVAGASGILPAAAAGNPENQPPNVPEWSKMLGASVVDRPYGNPSPFEKDVVRRSVPWLTATPESAINFAPLGDMQGTITPNGLHFERHHGGAPDIDPKDHRLIVHGLVERPLIFTLDEIKRFPSVSRIHFLECPANGGMEWKGAQMVGVQFTHGMLSNCEWTGVRLSTVLNEAGLKPEAKWLLAEGADAAAMTRSIPVEKAMADTLLVYAQNGEALRAEQGYPLRLIVPGWEGNVNVKWLRRLKLGDEPWHHREETSKYTDLMADGRARQFTFVMEANSVITWPCPEKPVGFGPGQYEVTGLAWSGYGKIKRVDVSFDGGANWRTAELQTPVLSKAATRFRIPWRWDGKTAFLQSRAMDESGYVQPSIEQLRAARGVNSVYHKNSIHTWRITPKGEVENVQIA